MTPMSLLGYAALAAALLIVFAGRLSARHTAKRAVEEHEQRLVAEREAAVAVAKLHESHRMLSMAASMSRIGHWHVDLVNHQLVWSDVVYSIYGFAPDRILTLEDAFEGYYEADRPRILALVNEAMRQGTPYAFTARIKMPDGTLRHVASQGQAERTPDGKITGIFGIIQDTSAQVAAENALKRSESHYRLLAENASDVIIRADLVGRCIYASRALIDIAGYTPDEFIGVNIYKLIHPDDFAETMERRQSLRTGEVNRITFDYRLRHKDGRWIWVEAHARPVRDEDGAVYETATVLRDVSERKALEFRLTDALEQAKSATVAKSSFLANMSHELRTPMNGVIGFTELLLAGDLGTEQRDQVRLIADSGRAMMRLLNDILEMAKIESHQLRLSEEAFDLRDTVQRCARLCEPGAAAKGLALAVTVDPAIPALTLGDPERLQQVLLNLLGNAVKFTERGSVALRASLDDVGGAPQLIIDVEDSGIGIAPDRLASVFNQFVQADGSIARRFGGTGLGLSISTELAALMGGKIEATSRVGEGTRMRLALPLRAATAERATAIGAAPQRIPSAAPPSGTARPRVLIAEDHDINQALILAIAEKVGVDATLACDGAAAVAAVLQADAAGHPFALVLMDIQMPIVDGLEATRQLREAGFGPDRLPIVALTANVYASDVNACEKAGMQAHLAKPVRIRDFAAIVARFTAVAPPAPELEPAAAPSLADRYAERRREALAAVDAALGSDAPTHAVVERIAALFHKLGGIAAHFDEAALGEALIASEHALVGLEGEEARAILAKARAAFDRAPGAATLSDAA